MGVFFLMKRKRKLLLMLAMLLVMCVAFTVTACNKGQAGQTQEPGGTEVPGEEKNIMPRFKQAEVVYIIRPNIKGLVARTLRPSEKLLLQSLQGVVAQRQAELYIGNANDKFLRYAKTIYNLTLDDGVNVYKMENGEEVKTESSTDWLDDMQSLIRHYIDSGDIQGYVKIRFKDGKYNQHENQSNQGCTLAGAYKLLIVSEDLEPKINEYFPDLEKKFDLSTTQLSEYDVIKEHLDKLNMDVLIAQAPPRIEHLREFGIANRAPFYFFNENTPIAERAFVYKNLNTMAHVYGWQQVDVTQDGVRYGFREDPHVDFASQHNANVIAADWCTNLSLWASLPSLEYKQKETKRLATDDEQVHYVTILYSDGDNLQWMSGGSFANDFFGNVRPDRKTMPFGWTATPNMVETLPHMLKYLYDNMTDIEHFVVPVSGYAYSHPAHFNNEALKEFVERTNYFMGKADMHLIAMKGVDQRFINAIAEQENVEGGFIMYGMDRGPGQVYWWNDKPFVNDRIIFWEDRGPSQDPAQVAKDITKINFFSTDKTKLGAYTFIQVHCWSYQYGELQRVFYNNIDKNVIKVVTPDEFIELIKKNIPAENGRYTMLRR